MTWVGQVFMFKNCFAVVTAGPHDTRNPGSTLGPDHAVTEPDRQVYTLAVMHDSGRHHYPVERLEDRLIEWRALGRMV